MVRTKEQEHRGGGAIFYFPFFFPVTFNSTLPLLPRMLFCLFSSLCYLCCQTEIHLFTIKEIKNASECIVELEKKVGIFKNMREVHREARGAAQCFSLSLSVLKNSEGLYNSTMHEDEVVYFFYKMRRKSRVLKLVT